jgi:hypothetical protein
MGQQLGETRSAMTKDFMDDVLPDTAEEVHEKHGWNKFYILFSWKEDLNNPAIIREGRVASRTKPKIMPLNSMCFSVDYPKGLIIAEWILPRDMGIDTTCGTTGGLSQLALNSNKAFWTGSQPSRVAI